MTDKPEVDTYAEAAVLTLTRTMGMMFRSLQREGMNRREALAVVIAWMATVMENK